MSGNIRSFLAIELGQEIKENLARIQSTLKQTGADVKWVKKNNIHLTLKFLGNINSDGIESITDVLEETVKKYFSFKAVISEIGAFPRIDSPRIIWVGIKKGAKSLCNIAKDLEDSLDKIGIAKEEKDFHPHITLGRVKSSLNRIHLIKKLKEFSPREDNTLEIKGLTLFKSTLTPKGPIYEVLKKINFKAR